MLGESIVSALAGVRRRLGRFQAVRGAAWGLIAVSPAVAAFAVARWLGWTGLSPWWAFLGPAVGLLGGAAVALLRGPRLEAAASAVDAHYGLKDRAVTALAFLRRPDRGEWESLQIADAARHLAGVNAKQVVPFRWPRALSCGLVAASAAVLTVMLLPAAKPLEAKTVGPNAGLVAMADDLAKDIDEIEKTAEETNNEELKDLVKQLREQTEALKEEDVELKEALATISQMQAAMQQHAQYNEALVDAQLSSLAGAMASAEALRPTAEKLEAGKNAEAAEELAKLEKVEPGKRGEKAAADRMKKLSEEMKGKGLASLSESVSEMSDGMSGANSNKFCKACKSLASQLKKHEARKQMNCLLCRQLDKLSECKGQCTLCFGNCDKEGNCAGDKPCDKNSLAEGLKPKKSENPSSNFGKTTSGNLYGDKTDLNGSGKQEQLTGQAGAGPSDIETSTSPEGREQAGRAYKERYEKYRKLSEEVLNGEPIPLGHRQTIRNYFELIRPTPEDETAELPAE